IVLIPGEAGIGKTRLLHEAQTRARQDGLQVYHGRCREDVRFPYLPFVEALRTYTEQTPGKIEAALGIEAELIRHLLPSSEVFTSVASASMTAQAEQDRLRRFLAMSDAFLIMARRSPMLLAIDDLHWADPPSLDLL